jgi:hypothetical protein
MAWCCAPAFAQDSQSPEGIDIQSIVSSMGGGMKMGAPDKAGKLPDFKEVTKDMVSRKGLFTLWSYPADAKDKDTEKLLCQIPASFLGEKFMLSTSFSGGGFFTGFPLDERVVQWELLDRRLLLIEPETRFVIDKGKEVGDVVSRTYPDRIRVAVPLVTKAPGGDPVIDLGALLKSDFADIGWMSTLGSFFGVSSGAGRIDSKLSKWAREPKSFPYNVEVGVELAVSRMAPPGSYDKKLVHYSFWKLPKSDYAPRVADDRVGYFMTTNQDWSKPSDSRDIFNRYVDRWPLVKRDPSLPLCEPKQPIVFYIEKTVPVKYRRAVRDGILEWNQAYEEIGFVNAVEVRQQTKDNEWKDLDPEDMRYSFFRWIVAGVGFAMGPHRANPFTGEIYDADIIFDDAMVRYFEQSAERLLAEGAMALKASDPILEDFLARFPQWRRPVRDWEHFSFGNANDPRLREAVKTRMRQRGHHLCDYADGMKHQMALAHTVLAGQPREVIDRFLYDIIKEVVMHEVGHTLGLRHNFKASSIWTLKEIKQRKANGEATTGSVMDYNPVLFFAQQPTEGNFVTPTIGPYDYWAVEYGYRPFDGNYKGQAKGEETEGASEAEEGKATAEGKLFEHKTGVQVSGDVSFDMAAIPPEILEKLPPEAREKVKQMLSSGEMAKMAHAAMEGGGPSVPPKGHSGPSFKAAPAGEEKMLHEIASRGTEAELAYATDEDCTFLAPDPRVNRFDMAADSLDWANARMDLVNKRMDNILSWAVKDAESWYHLRQAFVSLMVEKARVLDYVGRYIGGQYFNRSHRGDPDAQTPFELVEPQRQREALSFIEQNLFRDECFSVPPEVLNHLAPPRWWHAGTSIDFTMDFPVHDLIATLQWWNLFDRLFPNTLRRIHDAELKTASSDKFTVAEYLQRIQQGCWGGTTDVNRVKSGSWNDNGPFVSDIRRSLQREYLGLVEPLVREKPGRLISPDLHAMVQYSVKTLADKLSEVIKAGKADFASQAHLVACKSRIDRMLAPELDEYKPAPTLNLLGAESN